MPKNDIMRINEALAQVITSILKSVFEEQKHADQVIKQYFQLNKKWDETLRGIVATTVYDITRNARWYQFLSGTDVFILGSCWGYI